MKINKIKLHNFQLFKEAEINLDKINIITGVNHDDESLSSNGAGKSTIQNAIFFALYGNISGLKLSDLVRIGEKECSVTVECSLNGEQYIIERSYPSELRIMYNDKEIQANTLTLKQKWINEHICDENFFKKFRTVDNIKGINLLDKGIISLRKILMSFIDNYFIKIRKTLLDKKNERERFNKDKRLYTFHLSDKRLEILEQGNKESAIAVDNALGECHQQDTVLNELKAEKQTREKIITYKNKDIYKLQKANKCPLCLNVLSKVDISKIEKLKSKDIVELKKEMEEIDNILKNELALSKEYDFYYQAAKKQLIQIQECLMKLKEAFKFKEYKYTTKDVELYTQAIKVIDDFAGYYINSWFGQLSIVINDLLQPVGLQVEFTPDKEFLKIKNGTNVLKFEQLSSGQKIFLNTVFKLAMLLHKGETTGLILIDEGLSNLDKVNLEKFLQIAKNLNFQCLLIYQNVNNSIEEVNFIDVERKDGRSIII